MALVREYDNTDQITKKDGSHVHDVEASSGTTVLRNRDLSSCVKFRRPSIVQTTEGIKDSFCNERCSKPQADELAKSIPGLPICRSVTTVVRWLDFRIPDFRAQFCTAQEKVAGQEKHFIDMEAQTTAEGAEVSLRVFPNGAGFSGFVSVFVRVHSGCITKAYLKDNVKRGKIVPRRLTSSSDPAGTQLWCSVDEAMTQLDDGGALTLQLHCSSPHR